jgi:hypothetical protein
MSRLRNQGSVGAGITEAWLKTIIARKASEGTQLQAVGQALHDRGIEDAERPTVEELKQEGRTVRVYVWKTPFGDVVLATGPSVHPQIQLVNGNADWNDAPAGTYVRATRAAPTEALKRRMGKLKKALVDRAERPGPKRGRVRPTRPADPVDAVVELVRDDAPLEAIVAQVEELTKPQVVEVAAALDVEVRPADTAAEIKEAVADAIEAELPAEPKPARTRKPRGPKALSDADMGKAAAELGTMFDSLLEKLLARKENPGGASGSWWAGFYEYQGMPYAPGETFQRAAGWTPPTNDRGWPGFAPYVFVSGPFATRADAVAASTRRPDPFAQTRRANPGYIRSTQALW